MLSAGLFSCGGKRQVEPDDLDIPTTLPPEQILYREAKETFERWTTLFQDAADPAGFYTMLTWKSRENLKAQGVVDPSTFAAWFDGQRTAGKEPFVYSFSRIDVLEIDLKDTTRAQMTVTFVVTVEGQQFESSGLFTLNRERGSWKVPFADRGDYIRGWWQKEDNFDVTVREAGISSYASDLLGVEFKYPVAWDINKRTPVKIPFVHEATEGVLLSYQNPSSQKLETIVRIAELPEWMVEQQLVADTSIHRLKPLREELTVSITEPNLMGKMFWLYNPARKRIIAIFGAVDTTVTRYDNYAESINDLVRSFSIIK